MRTFPVLVVCAVLASQAPAQSALKSQLQAKYDKFTTLTRSLQREAVINLAAKTLSSDFVIVDTKDGEMGMSPYLNMQANEMSGIAKYSAYSNTIIGLRESGVSVICTIKSKFDLTRKGFSSMRVQGTSISEDHWAKTIHGWKIKKTVILKESILVDGKPYKG